MKRWLLQPVRHCAGGELPVTAAELTRDLYRNLVDQYYDVPPVRRPRSCWVMNQEWYDECCKMGWPEPGITTMLGLPFVVTENGGFPHLIAD